MGQAQQEQGSKEGEKWRSRKGGQGEEHESGQEEPGEGREKQEPSKERRTRTRTPVRRRSRSRSPARRRTRSRSPARRRTYSRSPRRAGRRSRSRESGDRRSRSPRRTFDLREKLLLKEEGQKRELAEIKRHMKVIQDSHKDDFNHVKFGVPGGGNEQQMKFVRDVKQIIAFAEESTYRWRAANEFASLLKHSNDSDMKKQEEAEKRAMKKIEGERPKQKKKAGYEKASDRGRRSSSRSVKKEKRSRSRSTNKDKRETRECYKCGKLGHISTNCYSKEYKDRKRR